MKRVILVCLVLQAVYAEKSVSVSINKSSAASPADVSYVEGKAPEELKAGPAKNNTQLKETIAHGSFIRSSNREIPEDDEIENEEFERFIQKYHNRPTIETVFVSTSPSPPTNESEVEELNEEPGKSELQAEVFKRPAQLRTFERSVAHPGLSSHILPAADHHQTYTILNQPHDASYGGSDGFILQSNGGEAQYATFNGGHYLPSGQGHGDQSYYQYTNLVPTTFNVAQNAIKTKTYEIRRPAIQKHYYDIEERVVIRPAGSVVVELDRPVAKVPTGESVYQVGGLQGALAGGVFQSSQGGLNFANTFGGSQGGLVGVGIQQSQGGVGISQGGGLSGISFQQSQGGIGLSQGGSQGGFDFSQGGLSGSGITYASSLPAPSYSSSVGGSYGSGITYASSLPAPSYSSPGGGPPGSTFSSSLPSPSYSSSVGGFQQSQGAIGGSQGGAGFQQSQGGIVVSTTAAPGSASSTIAIGTQQQQGAIGGSQSGGSGGGFQQSQGGAVFSTTPSPLVPQGSSSGGFSGIGVTQSQSAVGVTQNGFSGAGFQQSQGGGIYSTTAAPPVPQGSSSTTTVIIGDSSRRNAGSGFQQSQGAIGGSQGGAGFQQSQGGIVVSTTAGPGSSRINAGGFQQSQGGAVYSTTGSPLFTPSSPAPTFSGIGFQQSQGGFGGGSGISGAGFQQSQGGAVYSTVAPPYLPPVTPTSIYGGSNGGFIQSQSGIGLSQSGAQGGLSGIGFQQSQGGIGLSQGGSQGGFTGFQQSQGGVGISQGGVSISQGGSGYQNSQGGIIYSTTANPIISIGSSTPFIIRTQGSGGYPGVSSTTSGPIFISTQQGDTSGNVYLQANSNVQSRGSVSSTTTTERSFSLSQEASAFAKGSSSGSVQTVNKNIVPHMISIGDPNFQFPPYAEIHSRGAPYAHYKQEPFARVQAVSQDYPRMRYQGKLLTGEVQLDGGYVQPKHTDSGHESHGAIRQHHPDALETAAYVAEIPTSSPLEDQSQHHLHHSGFVYQQPVEAQANTQYQHQLVGSSQQPMEVSQISGSSHRQPAQVYQHFIRTMSQPIHISEAQASQHAAGQHAAQQHLDQQHAAQIHAISRNEAHPSLEVKAPQHAARQHLGQRHSAQINALPRNEAHHNSEVQNPEHSTHQQHLNHHHSAQINAAGQHPAGQHAAGQHAAQQHLDQQHAAQIHAISRNEAQPSLEDKVPQHAPRQHLGQQHSAQINALPRNEAHHNSEVQNPEHSTHQRHLNHHHSAQINAPQDHSPQHSLQNHAPHQYFVKEEVMEKTADYQSSVPLGSHNFIYNTPIYRQVVHDHQHPNHHNLVAQIRHQHSAMDFQQPEQAQYKTNQQTMQETKLQHNTETADEPIEVTEVQSSTHQQPMQYQQQVAATSKTLEPYNSGQRIHNQRSAPAKYTQDPNLSVVPAVHTVYFDNNQEKTSARSQNIEIPPETESLTENTSVKSSNIESTTAASAISSTTNAAAAISSTTSAQKEEHSTQTHRQTYASIVAQGPSGILYSPQKYEASRHSPGHKHHFVRFSSENSPLFAPVGRQLHFAYSQPPRSAYTLHTPSHFAPVTYVEPTQQHISVNNKGFQVQAQLPITRQSQIQLTASNKPAQVTDSKITRSQSHDESQHTSARYEAISSTTPDGVSTKKEHHKLRGPQKYRNEQTHSAITLRSGRTYGDHRVIASTPAPRDGGAASESVQTRRIVVNHPFQTIQEVVEQEPITKYHQVTVNAPAPAPALAPESPSAAVYHNDGNLQQGQQKAAYRASAPYKVAATFNHPSATLSFHHGGSH